MSLLDAQPVDELREKRRRIKIGLAIFAVLLLGLLWWDMRFWPEEHTVNKFFAAIESQNFEQAYSIWMADPNWKQHPQKYERYGYNDFYRDWGPGGEYGEIHSHKIEHSSNGSGNIVGGGSGVVIEIQINGRPVTMNLWVEKKDKSISYPP
ncbi:MAG TPA: hypothetical protein VFA71_12475 [Terriglobales bacterium]|nr:hypothetical protein [Terriglobales bacterium]